MKLIFIKVLAGILAAGGTFWGLFLSIFLMYGDWSHLNIISLMGLAGYVVTFGYFIRCFCNPSLLARRAIWMFSIFVQGYWLGSYVWGAIHGGARATVFEFMAVLWWGFAFVASLVSLFLEPRTQSA